LISKINPTTGTIYNPARLIKMLTETSMLYNAGISSVLYTTIVRKMTMSREKPIRIRNTAIPSIQMLYLTAAMRVKT
jgi:hypothetical protein